MPPGRVVNVLTNRPRVWLALDHPVILAAEMLMPSDLFSVPAGMILGIITSEGNKQSHAAIIARAMHIPCVVQVGREFLDDCDGRTVVLDADNGECILDPDANTRQQAVSRICELQWESEEAARISVLPNRTKDDVPFELLANCYGQEDIESALQAGASRRGPAAQRLHDAAGPPGGRAGAVRVLSILHCRRKGRCGDSAHL